MLCRLQFLTQYFVQRIKWWMPSPQQNKKKIDKAAIAIAHGKRSSRIESKWITMHISTINHFRIQNELCILLNAIPFSFSFLFASLCEPRALIFYAVCCFYLTFSCACRVFEYAPAYDGIVVNDDATIADWASNWWCIIVETVVWLCY